ncbi:hypothetical protein C1646_765631 [Rhizophagus diaphanus]|nr:hypothetical protein C1646_765631 [Rhizophagus diaphanus] [Rhizophagus sp. MUCL 43196]
MSTLNMTTKEMVRKYNKNSLFRFYLRKEWTHWNLYKDDFEIICRDRNFLKSDQRQALRKYHGMKLGPAMTLIEFVNDIKNMKHKEIFYQVTQIEGTPNELASSKIQDQINDIEALNEKLESDKVQLT